MSVASKNPFAILDAEEGGETPPAPEPLQSTTNQPSTRGGQRGRGNRGGPGARGGKYYPRGGARTSAPREGAEDDGADDSTGKKVEFVDRGRGGARGRSNRGRGDRGGSRGEGRRTYDRHSATGKTDSEKKIHQSWGGDEGQTELATETAAANDAAAEQAAPAENLEPSGGGDTEWGAEAGNTEWGAEAGNTEWGAEGGNTDWAAPPAPFPAANAEEPAERSDRRPRDRQEEEPDNTLTLDQYLAQQKEKSPIVPQLETRKIEQDESLWRGAKEIVKGAEEDTYFVGKTKSTPKSRTKKEEKVYLDIEARFERPDRGGRGRGGRGGDRGGGRERNQRRDGRSNGNTRPLNIDVGDEIAFPSLS